MRVIRAEMRRGTAAELSVVQFRSLALADYRGGASVSQIAEHIGLTAPVRIQAGRRLGSPRLPAPVAATRTTAEGASCSRHIRVLAPWKPPGNPPPIIFPEN